jgi:NADP-dependent 3-hydroxy acid dehydrogenase YdfG
MSEAQWSEMVDVNLAGVWRTTKAVVPRLIDQGQGGAPVLTSLPGRAGDRPARHGTAAARDHLSKASPAAAAARLMSGAVASATVKNGSSVAESVTVTVADDDGPPIPHR